MDALFAYLLCLIGGATAGGVVVGLLMRRRHRKGPDDARLRRHVMRGAYKILDGDYSGALDDFGAVIKADPQTPDTYFVLGRLYRRTGQYARAVHVHQNLAIRQDDPKDEIKTRALFELAEDYRAAGLMDRAVNAYVELLDRTPSWREALENLVTLALGARLWSVAAAYLPRLEKLTGKPDDALAAHVLAEHALGQIGRNTLEDARRSLKAALKRDSRSAHVACAFAHLHAAQDKPKAAVQALDEALSARPDLAHLVLDAAHALAHRHGFFERLDALVERRLDPDTPAHWALRLLAAQRMKENGDTLNAREAVSALVAEGVDVPPLRDLADALRVHLPPQWPTAAPGWRCRHCAQTQKTLSWFCPSCLGWGTLDAPNVPLSAS